MKGLRTQRTKKCGCVPSEQTSHVMMPLLSSVTIWYFCHQHHPLPLPHAYTSVSPRQKQAYNHSIFVCLFVFLLFAAW